MLPTPSHANHATGAAQDDGRRRPWREVELLLVVLLVVGIYFTRITDLTIRGEEPRWARVAQEMIDTGDFAVPRQQGQPFPDRPPLNSWAMILASQFTGGLNLVAIRLPSLLATLLVTVVIYVYGRNYLSRGGALVAAVAYATMGQILGLGRVAESDALLTLCLTGALCSWHYGYDRRNDPRFAWLTGFALAALAALAKGPQGPCYFVAITGVYVGLRRDWPFLLNRWYLAGLGLFALTVGSWQVPLSLALEPAAALRVWSEGGHLASRFQPTELSHALEHWVTFPFEVLATMLPWSFLLPVVATRWFRQNLGEARPLVALALVAWAVALPTCWLPTDSRPRYLMALYPCVALVVGLIVQRSYEAQQIGWWRRCWDQFLLTGVGLMVAVPIVLAPLWAFGGTPLDVLRQAVSVTHLVLYAAAAALAAATALWSRSRNSRWSLSAGAMALAGFLGLSYTGVVVDVQAHVANDPSADVTSIRKMLPPGERLVSFGLVHHLFAYYYAEPIEFHALDNHVAPMDVAATYFCYAEDPGFETPAIPFAWERVAEISCERAQSARPLAKMVIGRRVSAAALSEPSRRRTPSAGGPILQSSKPSTDATQRR